MLGLMNKAATESIERFGRIKNKEKNGEQLFAIVAHIMVIRGEQSNM